MAEHSMGDLKKKFASELDTEIQIQFDRLQKRAIDIAFIEKFKPNLTEEVDEILNAELREIVKDILHLKSLVVQKVV